MSDPAADRLTDRYGRQRRPRWPIALAVLIGAAGLAWVIWVVWVQSTPSVSSELESWRVVDSHNVTATVDVRFSGDVTATCVLQAYAEDHSVVGEVAFRLHRGRAGIVSLPKTIRTERRASSVEMEGCTAPGQNRPQ